jgi:GWxTD domain-containing protein
MLHPIADALERRQIDQLLENGSDLQRRRFIAGFWSQRYGAQSAGRFRSYLSAVRSVNDRFDARTTPGYKTDRGRVELQYGRPDLIEDRKYEPSTYPYEIWQYNRLRSESTQNQVNKVFIFANLSSAGDQYELIHSNAFGEVFNPRWSLVLNKRILPGMDIDETGSDIIQHGGRSNSNLIINGGSLDRVNRR